MLVKLLHFGGLVSYLVNLSPNPKRCRPPASTWERETTSRERTVNHDVTESIAVAAKGRAIPSVVFELFLTLGEAQLGPVADGHHGVRLGGAEGPLLWGESRDLAAYYVRIQSHYRPADAINQLSRIFYLFNSCLTLERNHSTFKAAAVLMQ